MTDRQVKLGERQTDIDRECKKIRESESQRERERGMGRCRERERKREKERETWIVLGWETAWELRVPLAFFFLLNY